MAHKSGGLHWGAQDDIEFGPYGETPEETVAVAALMREMRVTRMDTVCFSLSVSGESRRIFTVKPQSMEVGEITGMFSRWIGNGMETLHPTFFDRACEEFVSDTLLPAKFADKRLPVAWYSMPETILWSLYPRICAQWLSGIRMPADV